MALFARAPPLWLSDPHQKSKAPTCVLVNCASFLAVWYAGLGHRFPGWAQAVALALMVGFGLMLFVLRQRVCERFGPRDHAFIHSFYGVPEAWLSCYPLAVAVWVVALDAWGAARVLPTDPVRAFACLFVCVYTITNWMSNGGHILFYDWFSSSGLKIAERRGMGARGFDLYGVFKQAWIPRLSPHAFQWLCLLMNWNFWLALQGWSPTALHFLLGFPLVLLRKSMLFAETSAGMHSPILLPAVCWYLAFSPQLWVVTGPALSWTQEGPGWPACFLKVHILSMYVMAGAGKILTTFRQGHWNWANATNMQYYLFVSGWARPGCNQSALSRTAWLVTRPWACCLLQVGGLVFQLGCPVALWGGRWSVAVFVVAVQFHIGSFYLLGLDFMSQWAPCLLVFLVDRRPASFLPEAGGGASLSELCCWSLGAAHLLGQLYCATTFREQRVADDIGGMPFSSMYMFCINSNIFGGDMVSWYTLMTGDQRSSGHLGIMEWSGPIFTSHNMGTEDMMKLPFKAVWFGHSMFKHSFVQQFVKPEFAQQRFHLFANFSVGPELEGALREVCLMLEPQQDERLIHDPHALKRLVSLQRKASDAFFASVMRAAQAKLVQRGESFLPDDIERLLKLERASDSSLSYELTPHTAA